jgi:DNA-directed RNA polymerase specialized sigma54-like protein
MCTVFGNIQVERTNSGWLPVRRFFSKAIESLDGGTNNDKKEAVNKVVAAMIKGCPP